MKNLLLKCAIVASFLLFLTSCGSGSDGDNKTYTNKKHGYSFDYPAEWTQESSPVQHPNLIVQIFEPETSAVFRPNVNLVVTDLTPDEKMMTRAELFEYISDVMNSAADITSEHNFNDKIMFAYSQNYVKIYQVLTVKDNKAFWLTLSTVDDDKTNAKYEQMFEDMMHSIKM